MGAQTMAGGAGMMGNVAAGNATAMAMFVTKVIATNQSNDHHPLFSMLPCVHSSYLTFLGLIGAMEKHSRKIDREVAAACAFLN